VALSQGALAASFSVSGQQFTVSADHIEGTGFTQYGAVDKTADGAKPVTVVGMGDATITNLCQSVVIPVGAFGIDNVSMVLHAGGEGSKPVEAKTLYIDATDLSTNATFKDIDIGVSVDDTTKGPGLHKGDIYKKGSFAQQATSVELTDVHQTAWATTAGTFKLSGLHMSVKKGKHECH
jgi:hypothetical protein